MITTPAQVIAKKRDGVELSTSEIQEFIAGVINETVADYQTTAFLMATFLKRMTLNETVALTRSMTESGEVYDLSKISGPKIDKHSTGGVGDKVSLILAPLAAACGLKVPMMSGRGLGHTGGTLDKLESITGFRTQLSKDEFFKILEKVGCAMIGQSQTIAPADRKLYALRDVTGTVECIPLIVASILSKKIAEGTDGLVLDVKCGNGAFMKTKPRARQLATQLYRVGKKLGLSCHVLITNMDQPLGYAVGHALEVRECIEILKCEKPEGLDCSSNDLKELTTQLCADMLHLGKITKSVADGRKLAHQKLTDGSAYKKFLELVEAQGGDIQQVENPDRLPRAPKTLVVKARKKGFLSEFSTETIGHILIALGGGRRKVVDKIDLSVGIIFHKKLGSKLSVGDTIATIHAPNHLTSQALSSLEDQFHKSIRITPSRKPVPKLILDPNVK